MYLTRTGSDSHCFGDAADDTLSADDMEVTMLRCFFFRLNSFTGAEKLQISLHPPLYNHYYLNYCFGSILDQMTNTDFFFRLPRWVQLYRSLWETSPLLCELSKNGLSGWFQVLFNATTYSFSKSRRWYSSFCRQLCRAEVWSALTGGKHKKCFKLHSTFQCHS